MGKIRLLLLTMLVLMQLGIPGAALAEEDFDYKSEEFKAVASQFLCNCGCGEDHFECDPSTCSNTKTFKKELADRMKLGWTKDQIRDYYVKQYGEEILMAPQKKGFSLTAWVTPFVVLIVAAVGVFFAIRKWVGAKKDQVEEQPLDQPSHEKETENEVLRSMIDEERKKYF